MVLLAVKVQRRGAGASCASLLYFSYRLTGTELILRSTDIWHAVRVATQPLMLALVDAVMSHGRHGTMLRVVSACRISVALVARSI